MNKYKRVFVIVIDSLGIGEMADSKEYGDIDVDTLGHIARSVETFNIPNMRKMGISNLHKIAHVEKIENPLGYQMKMREASVGKDTMTGHWEMMGLHITKPFKTFTETGFPQDLLDELSAKTGHKIVGNKSASGTEILDELGTMPLPPYIKVKLDDKDRYQTVYAKNIGSAAAPTAGLHFTKEMLQALREKGVETAFVTLHVGLGTFRPVKEDDVLQHKMHSEHYHLPQETVDKILQTKQNGGRVIAVGTTSCRTLEAVATEHDGKLVAADGYTDIFIYPGYQFKVLDGLVTNFHLPESTLIMLVSALLGYEKTMHAYDVAVKERYRFFSFGDAMCIL